MVRDLGGRPSIKKRVHQSRRPEQQVLHRPAERHPRDRPPERAPRREDADARRLPSRRDQGPRHPTGRQGRRRRLRLPGEILQQALRLIAENPREFLLLMAMWTLLAIPAYLGLRRRSRARALSLAWSGALERNSTP